VVALLYVSVLLALDHHAAERIPTHEHIVTEGSSTPPHIHGFEVAHTHVHGVALRGSGAATQISGQSILVLLAYVAMAAVAFLAELPGNLRDLPALRPRILRDHLVAQLAPAPPTPPPPFVSL